MLTSELVGKPLDYWAARALGKTHEQALHEAIPYSTDGAHGMAVIREFNIHVSPPTSIVHRNGGPSAGYGPMGIWSATTWHKGHGGRRHVAHHETDPQVAVFRCLVASIFGPDLPDDAAAAGVPAAHEWQTLTGAGQIKVGDNLKFTIGSKHYYERVKQVLHPGTPKEEVVYDKGRNFYFIVSMVLDGTSNHKHLQFRRPSLLDALSPPWVEPA
jgi:hypothetical protein